MTATPSAAPDADSVTMQSTFLSITAIPLSPAPRPAGIENGPPIPSVHATSISASPGRSSSSGVVFFTTESVPYG
ncbi:hypothetical protein ELQ90_03165 [Labedella phragmitis]|uniref:Uncharacterized protein n=1 Tax=Labedella phragmitis TaxID=2498849 RepID=A0A3S4DJL8_9MICO|nr:hypothetical protein ELQ90_03165 [Labedella phragmitis]